MSGVRKIYGKVSKAIDSTCGFYPGKIKNSFQENIQVDLLQGNGPEKSKTNGDVKIFLKTRHLVVPKILKYQILLKSHLFDIQLFLTPEEKVFRVSVMLLSSIQHFTEQNNFP